MIGLKFNFDYTNCEDLFQTIDYVNPFIGTGIHGNTIPGAQAPFGMISVSPNTTFDNYDAEEARPGYKFYRNEIYGFGLTHFSGVGCHAMQDLQFIPIEGNLLHSPVNNKGIYKSLFSHEHETAKPGYYSVKLLDYNIYIKFTTTVRSVIGEIEYNSNNHFFIFQPTNSANNIADGSIFIDTTANRIMGWVLTGGFCWRDPGYRPYRLYFVIEFDSKFKTYGIWKNQTNLKNQISIDGKDIGAYISFHLPKNKKVKMKSSISYVSTYNALLNLNTEIPDWNFDKVHSYVKNEWENVLSRIKVDTDNKDDKITFYTALYHSFLAPNVFNDVNGEYIGFDGKVYKIEKGRNKYANFSMWDTYRTTSYLQAMLFPDIASDIIHSLYLDAIQCGAFTNWSMNNIEYGVMNGYSSIPFIANMYTFGAQNVDIKAINELLKKISTSLHTCQNAWGWWGIDEYLNLGFVPVDKYAHGTSMTMEYSIADYCIAKLFLNTGDTLTANYYFRRSQNIFNLFDSSSLFIRGRNTNGKFIEPFDLNTEHGYNEGNAIQYFWSVPHSICKLIDKAGGMNKVENILDTFMSKINVGWAPEQPFYWLGNEPCFGIPYIYIFLQKPWKTQFHIKRINNYFKNTPDGLPGDDDAGAMSSYYVFNSLGLYPYLPAEPIFLISSPIFKNYTILLSNGNKIKVSKYDLNNDIYINSIKINGQEYSKFWLNWNDMKNGINIELIMSNVPNVKNGTNKNDIPPCYYPNF